MDGGCGVQFHLYHLSEERRQFNSTFLPTYLTYPTYLNIQTKSNPKQQLLRTLLYSISNPIQFNSKLKYSGVCVLAYYFRQRGRREGGRVKSGFMKLSLPTTSFIMFEAESLILKTVCGFYFRHKPSSRVWLQYDPILDATASTRSSVQLGLRNCNYLPTYFDSKFSSTRSSARGKTTVAVSQST
jgi:hypothetical protein